MMDSIKIEVKKSDLKANCEFDLHQIQQKNENLLDCNITKDEDKFTFDYILNNALPFNSTNKFNKSEKYILLINISQLITLFKKINFQMEPKNIYIDINMMPKIMMRDVYKNEQPNEGVFIRSYKAIIGTVLNSKYTFDDFFQGGEKLLQKSKSTAPFIGVKTTQDIYEILVEEFEQHKKNVGITKVNVDKSKFRNLLYFRRISIVVTLVLVVTCSYFGLYIIPENNAVIKATETFVKQDYINTIESLKNIDNNRLSSNSKYIYAVSYIKTDALSNEQKNNILSSVTVDSNEKILTYWINLSKNNYDEAIDLSKQLGNKEYLLYGYMKQKTYVEKDGILSGQERETKLKEIDSNIKELTENGTKNLDKNDTQDTNKEE